MQNANKFQNRASGDPLMEWPDLYGIDHPVIVVGDSPHRLDQLLFHRLSSCRV
jgi:hypothetical protein